MKTFIYIICLLGISGNLFAQNIINLNDNAVVNQQYNNKMQAMFAQMNLDLVPSGVLFDRGISFIDLKPYNGQLSDTNETTNITFGLAYASLMNMSVKSETSLPNPEVYRQVMDKQNHFSDTILIAGLHQVYHSIDTLAIQNDLLNLQGDNLIDVPNRTSSPYNKQELFLLGTNVTDVKSNILNIVVDSDLFFNNSGKTIRNLEVDMDNGKGFVKGKLNTSFKTSYSAAGKKHLKFKITYTDNSVYYSHFKIYTEGPSKKSGAVAPDITQYITPLQGPNGFKDGRGGGHIHVFLSCGHSQIVKPFIWAEGYNPIIGNIDIGITKEDVLDRLSHNEAIIGGLKLREYLEENGYDIIVLDYDNGADYLSRTAEFIAKSIRWVNARKHSGGSYEKNILLGQSMGGVCAMYALKSMETITNEDHEVGSFIIFDSPIQGANIPLSAQAGLLSIASMPVNIPYSSSGGILKDYVSILDDAVDLLNLPASRGMIKYMASQHPLMEPQLCNTFYNYLHNVLGGMPTDCEVYAITNGSNKGVNGAQEYLPGDTLIGVNTSAIGVATTLIGNYISGIDTSQVGGVTLTPKVLSTASMIMWVLDVNVSTNILMYAIPSNLNDDVFIGEISLNPWWSSPILYLNNHWVLSSSLPEIDNAPGGFAGAFENLPLSIPTSLSSSLAVRTFKMNTWCFTPTMSVLNYHGPYTDNRFHSLMHNFENNTAEISANSLSGIDNYLSNSSTVSTADGVFQNTAHTWFTNEQAGYMLYILVGKDLLGNLSQLNTGNSYNYGKVALTPYHVYHHNNSSLTLRTDPVLDHDLTVQNSILGVNRSVDIGLTTVPNSNNLGVPPINSSFTMQLGHNCDEDDPITLRLERDGVLMIGDTHLRTGNVVVNDHHRIVVENGGTLIIEENSSLFLNEDANLILKSGAKLINRGVIMLNGNSKVIYEENVNFIMDKEASEFVFNGGAVYLQKNALFTFTHANSPQAGNIIVKENAKFYADESNCEVLIQGKGINHDIVLINANKILEFVNPSNFNKVSFTMASTKFKNGSKILVPCEFHALKAKFSNVSATVDTKLVVSDDCQLVGCDFNDVNVEANYNSMINLHHFKSVNSEFDFSALSGNVISIVGGSYFLYHSTFNLQNQQVSTHAVQSLYCTAASSIIKCTFNKGNGVYDYGNNDLSVTSSNFLNQDKSLVKDGGVLNMKCNGFASITTPVTLENYARLNAGVYLNQGYNKFQNTQSSSLIFNYSSLPSLYEGYNDFSKGTNNNYFEGDILLTTAFVPYFMNAGKNGWGAGIVPNQNNFSLYFGSLPSLSTFLVSSHSPMTGYCNQFSPGDIIADPVGPGDNSTSLIIPGFNGGDPISVKEILSMAVSLNEDNDSIYGNNFQSMHVLHQVIKYDFRKTRLSNNQTADIVGEVVREMQSTFKSAINRNQIQSDLNVSSFQPMVQQYVDGLNLMSSYLVGSNNNASMFLNELNKVQLYLSINHPKIALSILNNTEYCGLNALDQKIVNFNKFGINEYLSKEAFGYKAFLTDSVFTDSTGFKTSLSNELNYYTFNSIINSVEDIDFRNNCGPHQKSNILNKDLSFNLYPNPSNEIVKIEYFINSEEQGKFMIYNLNGKTLLEIILMSDLRQESIDLNKISSGLYLYKFMVNEEVVKAGKFIKN
ncbi:hypothetical protein DNU06_01785 [Putridiphycobacter roseus]|uniref:Secretion system C-terminal sorting domain-containing protein n=1 Tax=Putridiphycobacter roseus TaxID=2219161 RepID=A0A2W1NL64_9FLAO|nr:T9SS type A sorting domain-containing protein [Putridiphycobacter roseus]PZE18586.1 hypothetical protein DNU06_01785 [Putridiphycobacter roseus]